MCYWKALCAVTFYLERELGYHIIPWIKVASLVQKRARNEQHIQFSNKFPYLSLSTLLNCKCTRIVHFQQKMFLMKPVLAELVISKEFCCTMNYMESMFSLVLFGGKTVTKVMDSDSSFYLNDLWLYHIPSNQWTRVECFGVMPDERYSHVSAVCENKLMIFGGINLKGICKRETYVIEIDEHSIYENVN